MRGVPGSLVGDEHIRNPTGNVEPTHGHRQPCRSHPGLRAAHLPDRRADTSAHVLAPHPRRAAERLRPQCLGRHEAHGLASLDWNGRGFETMSI